MALIFFIFFIICSVIGSLFWPYFFRKKELKKVQKQFPILPSPLLKNLSVTASNNRNSEGNSLQFSMHCNIFVLPEYVILLPSENPLFSFMFDVPVVLKRTVRQPEPDRFEIIEVKAATWKQVRITYFGSKHPFIVNPNWKTDLILKPKTEEEKKVLEEDLMK